MSDKPLNEEYDVLEEDVISGASQVVVSENELDKIRPRYGTKEWDTYVKSQFTEDEMIDSNPFCHALRRVAVELLGDIIYSAPKEVIVQGEPNHPGKVTVSYELRIAWMGTDEVRVFGDVSEVWEGNTDDLFLAHPSATASTKAEGRCLRKALMVRCVAVEELPGKKDVVGKVREAKKTNPTPTNGNMNPKDPITGPQKGLINRMCGQMSIDVMKFVNLGSGVYDDIDQVSKQTGIGMIKKLNEYQADTSTIPADIR